MVVQAQAKAQVTHLGESELFVAGVLAYWAEGCKNNPGGTARGTMFINSDEGLIQLFLRWLTLVGVEADRLAFRLMIHESADITAALLYWSRVVGVPAESFGKTQLKRHNPRRCGGTWERTTTAASSSTSVEALI